MVVTTPAVIERFCADLRPVDGVMMSRLSDLGYRLFDGAVGAPESLGELGETRDVCFAANVSTATSPAAAAT